MGQVQIPLNARAWARRKRWLAEEHPGEFQPVNADLPGREIQIPEAVDLRDLPATEEQLISDGQADLESPEQGGYGGDSQEDGMEIGVISEGNHPGHIRPETTYANRGAFLCDRISELPPEKWIDPPPTLIIIVWGHCYTTDSPSTRYIHSKTRHRDMSTLGPQKVNTRIKTFWVGSPPREYLLESLSNSNLPRMPSSGGLQTY